MEKNLDEDPIDLDVVSKKSQEEDNSSDKDYISAKKKETMSLTPLERWMMICLMNINTHVMV